jgi:apolipoprotein N-acyltransferase
MSTSIVSGEPGSARKARANPETDDSATTSAASSPPAADPRWRLVGLGLASGVLLWLCHFPVAWGWLAWVALVPLLTAMRSPARTRWLFWSSWLGGLLYFYAAISWMTVADARMIACWVLLATYCSLYFPLTVYVVRRLEQHTRLPLVVTLPVVWVALEYFRSFFGTGFPWYLLAHTQHNVLPLIQVADLGGAFAVSFLVAAVNVVVFESLSRWSRWRQWTQLPEPAPEKCCGNLVLQGACVLALLVATLGYGMWRLADDQFETGPRVALLQADLDQRLKNSVVFSTKARDHVLTSYKALSAQAAALPARPALIVWPETSCPYPWFTVASHIDLTRQDPKFRRELEYEQGFVRKLAQQSGTYVLLGINTTVLDYDKKSSRYNSALLLDPSGRDVLRYDKLHRVPFGEYVPFRDWLPFMNWFAPYDHDYSIGCGDGLTRLTVGQYRFGVLICYEDTDPFLARDYAVQTKDGPPVDFLVNISNDGWFDGSSEHEEHLAISRFRAVESRKALVRAVNMGISAVIDGNGRVLAPVKSQAGGQELWTVPPDAATLAPGEWAQYKQVNGVLVAEVPIDRRGSLYATWGDWLPTGCWAIVLCGMAWAWRRRRMRTQTALS